MYFGVPMNIVPCCGVCNLGRLSVEAGRIVAEQNGGKLFSLGTVATGMESLEKIENILVIDGCEKACACQLLSSLDVEVKWSLDIARLGIERSEGCQISEDDLLLVIDAVEAACTDLGEQIPKVSGMCGCC